MVNKERPQSWVADKKTRLAAAVGGVVLAPLALLGCSKEIVPIAVPSSTKHIDTKTDVFDARFGSAACADVCSEANRVGSVSKKQKDNKIYEPTFFGYSSKEQVAQGAKDHEDNMHAKYERQIPECMKQNLLGKDCEEAVKYFSAGAGPENKAQFKIGAKIKLTSPTGKVVVVRAIDMGPNIRVQRRDKKAKFDMSWDAYKALGYRGESEEKVKAEEIPELIAQWVPLGPIK